VASWINLIKNVKSSDVEEIAAAYESALPFVVQDWAKMILKLAKSKRLPIIEKIDKVHGDKIGQMVRDEVTAQHLSLSQKTSSQRSPTYHSK
jgi:hypothetical protein